MTKHGIMKVSRLLKLHKTGFFLKCFSVAFAVASLLPVTTRSQGLINDGAYITNRSAYIYIQGGASIGNFTNNDKAGYTGQVDNSGFIDITGNWFNNSAQYVFTGNSGTVEMLGANQNLGGTTTTWFNNLNLLGSGTKTMLIDELTGGGYASPAGVLALNDRPVALNTFKLTVNNPLNTAVTRTSGYIISESNSSNNTSIIQWNVGANNASYIFPFGVTTSPNYIPLTITKTSGTANILASTRPTSTTDNQPWHFAVSNMYSSVVPGAGEVPVVIDRWWDINATAAFTGAVDFTYRGVENTTTYSPTSSFSAQNWVSSYWNTPVGSGPGVLSGTAVVSIPSQALGSNTPWVLSSLQAPLPIELLSFDARLHDKVVHLNWSTASELNNSYFEVQRSQDNKTFETIDIVAGAGNSTSALTYADRDSHPYTGVSYYRLRQVDFDGKFSFSQSVPVRLSKDNAFDFLFVSPSASDGKIVVGFTGIAEGKITVQLVDVLSNEVMTKELTSIEGFNRNELVIPGLAAGVYYITLSDSEHSVTKKIFIN
jgi:hypothetical protein